MMLTRIIKHEWRNLIADRTLPLIALLLALLIGYGVYNGQAWLSSYRASSEGLPEKSRERLAKMKDQLSAAEKRNPPPQNLAALTNPFRAATVTQQAILPASPLEALAVGQSDLLPNRTEVTVWSGSRPGAGNYDYQSPINLLAGRFDLAFALIYLYPLLILSLSYNLISAEREQGTLAMLLAQPVSLKTLEDRAARGRRIAARSRTIAHLRGTERYAPRLRERMDKAVTVGRGSHRLQWLLVQPGRRRQRFGQRVRDQRRRADRRLVGVGCHSSGLTQRSYYFCSPRAVAC
jgi:hypothetical protein